MLVDIQNNIGCEKHISLDTPNNTSGEQIDLNKRFKM